MNCNLKLTVIHSQLRSTVLELFNRCFMHTRRRMSHRLFFAVDATDQQIAHPLQFPLKLPGLLRGLNGPLAPPSR